METLVHIENVPIYIALSLQVYGYEQNGHVAIPLLHGTFSSFYI
jgi:hypothetical protein